MESSTTLVSYGVLSDSESEAVELTKFNCKLKLKLKLLLDLKLVAWLSLGWQFSNWSHHPLPNKQVNAKWIRTDGSDKEKDTELLILNTRLLSIPTRGPQIRVLSIPVTGTVGKKLWGILQKYTKRATLEPVKRATYCEWWCHLEVSCDEELFFHHSSRKWYISDPFWDHVLEKMV